jgi:DNA-3-methyladenine glycosylase
MSSLPLPREFYNRPAEVVAPELLGKLLVSRVGGHRCVGRIVETEAYLSVGDPACHAHRGITRRNASMFGPPGRAYVYMIHARWCFNAVTEAPHTASAVLIRALEPVAGEDIMRMRRNRENPREWARGPARLCQSLAIDGQHDGHDLTRGSILWIMPDPHPPLSASTILATGRVGISAGQQLPLRFSYAANRWVSLPRP